MDNKGFEGETKKMKTLGEVSFTEKPFNQETDKPIRVDINILRSKLQELESKEFKKNMFILVLLILALGSIGIFLSL